MTEPAIIAARRACPTPGPSTAIALRLKQSEDCAALGRVAEKSADATELAVVVPHLRRLPPRSARPSAMAELVSSWPTPSLVVVNAYGQIDASNSATMTDYALVLAISGRGLILDLSGVMFFSIEGFSALHRVAVGCAQTGIAWSLVPGAAVSRVLRVCDPEGRLPATDTVDGALADPLW